MAAVALALPTHIVPQLNGIAIVLIEDEADARDLVTALLNAQGVTVHCATTAADAWPMLTGGAPPDALICDIGLPGEDGYSLLQRLRHWEQAHAQEALPALALTALGGMPDRVAALQAGFQMHVAKPLDPQELLLVLESLLARGQRRSSAKEPRINL